MFTLELKINGSLISHIYGVNTGTASPQGTVYSFEAYTVATRRVRYGSVIHNPEDGIEALAVKILSHKPKPKKKSNGS